LFREFEREKNLRGKERGRGLAWWERGSRWGGTLPVGRPQKKKDWFLPKVRAMGGGKDDRPLEGGG